MKCHPHQNLAKEKFVDYYYIQNNARGIISMACGSGKSFTAFNIIKYCVEEKQEKLFIFSTSRMQLVTQIAEDFIKWLKINKIKANVFLTVSGKKTLDCCTYIDSKYELQAKLQSKSDEVVIIITTYQSSWKTVEAISEINKSNKYYQPNLIILDEAHNTAGSNENDKLKLSQTLIHLYEEDKTCFFPDKILYMTATPLCIKKQNAESTFVNNEISYSMDNMNLYGDIFFDYSFSSAIKDGFIVDWKTITLVYNDDDTSGDTTVDVFKQLSESYKTRHKLTELNFCTQAILLLRNIEKYKINHILVYFDDTHEVNIFEQCLKELNFNQNIIFYSIHSKKKTEDNERNLKDFKNFKQGQCKILLCVDQFNEGIDLCICDSVMFTKPKSSETEIVQCIGRCLRLYKDPISGYEKQHAYVFIPTLVHDSKEDSYSSKYRKIREISDRLRDNYSDMYTRKVNIKPAFRLELSDKLDLIDNVEVIIALDTMYENKKTFYLDNDVLCDAKTASGCFDFADNTGSISNFTYKQLKRLIAAKHISTMADLGNEIKTKYCKSPHLEYKSPDFICYWELLNCSDDIMTYDQSVKFIKTLRRFEDVLDWKTYCGKLFDKALEGITDDDDETLINNLIKIPYYPNHFYMGEGWVSWETFLGTTLDHNHAIVVKTKATDNVIVLKELDFFAEKDKQLVDAKRGGDLINIEGYTTDLSCILSYLNKLGFTCPNFKTKVVASKQKQIGYIYIFITPYDYCDKPVVVINNNKQLSYDPYFFKFNNPEKKTNVDRTEKTFITQKQCIQALETLWHECGISKLSKPSTKEGCHGRQNFAT